MATIAENLIKLLNIKGAIKEALFFVGQEVADKMEDWAMSIRNICNVPFNILGWNDSNRLEANQSFSEAVKMGEILKKNIENNLSITYIYCGLNRSIHFNGIKDGAPIIFPNTELSHITKMTLGYVGIINFPFLNLINCNEINNKICSARIFRANTPNLRILNLQDSYSLESLHLDITNVDNLNKYALGGSVGMIYNLVDLRLSGLGTKETFDSITLFSPKLGLVNELYPNALNNLIYTLLDSSFDRVNAGYSVFTITMYQDVYDRLTTQQIEAITNKGYTIALM